MKKFKFVTISTNQTIKNLTSIEICGLQKIYDLKQINIPNIKKLKIKKGSIVKMPFSLLNKWETLILGAVQIKIYSIPENNNTFELKNLKYLKLNETGVTKKLNKKFNCPNLIYFKFNICSLSHKNFLFGLLP